MHTVLKLAQLRWTGYVIRMTDERLPKKVIYGELQEGKRSQGGQKKRYKDTLKASLKDFDIPEIKMKRLESPPSGHFMIVARVPVAPPTIRRHTVSKTKLVL